MSSIKYFVLRLADYVTTAKFGMSLSEPGGRLIQSRQVY